MLGQTSIYPIWDLAWIDGQYIMFSNIPPCIPSKNNSYFFLLSGYDFFSISWCFGAFIFIFSFFVHSRQTAKVLIFLILCANELQKEASLKDVLLTVFSAFKFFTLTHLTFVKKRVEKKDIFLWCVPSL